MFLSPNQANIPILSIQPPQHASLAQEKIIEEEQNGSEEEPLEDDDDDGLIFYDNIEEMELSTLAIPSTFDAEEKELWEAPLAASAQTIVDPGMSEPG